MKKLYIFLLLLLFFQKGFSQESSCEKFKVGKFLYTSEGFPNIIVTRNETIQTEIIKESPIEIQGSIVWKSNCSYELIYTKCPIEEYLGKKIFVEIFEVKGNTAKGTSQFEGMTINFNLEKLDL